LEDPRELDAVVVELQRIERQTGMDRTLGIGKLILQRFFGGSAQAWHERRKNKNNSIRRLAQRPGCPFRRSALNQAIGIYVAWQSLRCDRTFGHIGACHIGAVLHLDLEAQKQWLDHAENARWSVRQLKEEITLHRRQTGERRGRPRAAETGKGLSEIRKIVGVLERAVESLRQGEPARHDQIELARLVERLAAAEQNLARVSRRPTISEPCLRPAELTKTDALSPLKEVG
jgi:hypothetical protein